MKTKILCILMIAALWISAAPIDATAAGDPPVRMAVLQTDIHQLAFWVAREKGMFERNGVQVDLAGVFRAGPEIMSAFAAGSLDMAYVGEAPSTTAVANRAADVVAVAQVNTEGSALVIGKTDDHIKTLADLTGKTVAVPGHSTVQDFLLRKALATHNVDISTVNIMVVKPPEMIAALRTGQIDAFVAWEPHPSKSATMGVGKNLMTSGEMWAAHPCCVLVSNAEFLKNNREAAKSVLKAHVEATKFILENREEAVKIGMSSTGMDEETVRRAMETVNFTYDLNIEGEKEYVQFLSEIGYIRVPDIDGFVDRFIRGDLLKEVLNP